MTVHQTNLAGLSREALEAMVLKFQQQPVAKLTLRVSKKGAVSLYGMGRWPTTLYPAQWEKVLGEAETIRSFIEANKALLSSGKDDPRFAGVKDDNAAD